MPDQQSKLFRLIAQLVQAGPEPSSRDEALQALTEAAQEAIIEVDAVSITTHEPRSGYVTLVATDALALSGDKLQYDLDEGPCVDAAGGQALIKTGELARDERWRHYAPRASSELGVVSQLAIEMYSGGNSFGGLNLYSRSRRAFDDDEAVSLAELFASQAAVLMGRTATVQQFSQGMATREIIGRATGLIMERYGLDEQRAFQFLVRLSNTGNIKLHDVAAEINKAANDKAAGG